MNIPYVQIKEIVDLNTYKLEIMYQPPTMNIPKEKEDLIIRNDSNIKINMSICTKGGTCAKPSLVKLKHIQIFINSISLNKLILYV
jgi:hypothetical protein